MAIAGQRAVVGDSPARVEDDRLLRGEGRYLDDLAPEGLTHAAVLRSTHAHATLVRVDVDEARRMPGVLLVLTGQDIEDAGLLPTWPHGRENVRTGEPFRYEGQPLLAIDRVRYVGEPVALVVAETRSQALDAMEAVAVEYDDRPAVVTPAAARADGAPQLSAAVPGNRCLDWGFGDADRVDAALRGAAHRVVLDVKNHRVAMNAMEPRGVLSWFEPDSGTYRLELSSQNIHVIRDHIARSLGTGPDRVRVTAPDVGGGFGVRNFVYAEYILVAWAARACARPVKWVASRAEGFISDHQARDFEARAELGMDAQGRFTALRVDCDFNVGAFLIGAGGAVPTGQYCTCPGTVYAIDAVHLNIAAVLTHTVPIGVTRGPGFAEMVDLMERIIDAAAARTGIDRVTLRRRNLVPAASMPWTNAVGTTIDSGDFPGCLERALTAADHAGFEARRSAARAAGRLRGLGIANHIKATGGPDEENIEFRFADGELVFTTGTQAIGQGHETTFRQIACTLLGLPFDRIRYVAGDSHAIAMGGGHGSSRATYMASTAMSLAARRVLARARPIAAGLLQAAEHDVEFSDGSFNVTGTDRRVGLLEVAESAADEGSSLDTYQRFRREAMTYPNGCHVAEVEVDPDTGAVSVVGYTAVDDYGVLVNPMVASGQAHGAIAQGVGQALLEEVAFDAAGQVVTGSFMDYAMPRADDVPGVGIHFNPTRCTTNPLGVKGCGEAGAIAGYPAVANAVLHALDAPGATLTGAASPHAVWKLLQGR